MKIEELDLTVGLYHALIRNGIRLVESLVTYSRKDLLSMKSLGPASVLKLEDILAEHGYTLRTPDKLKEDVIKDLEMSLFMAKREMAQLEKEIKRDEEILKNLRET